MENMYKIIRIRKNPDPGPEKKMYPLKNGSAQKPDLKD